MYRIFKLRKGRVGRLSSLHYELRRVGFNFHIGVAGRKVYNFRDTLTGLVVVDMRYANFIFSKLDGTVYKTYHRELFLGLVNGYFSILLRKCDFYSTQNFFRFI